MGESDTPANPTHELFNFFSGQSRGLCTSYVGDVVADHIFVCCTRLMGGGVYYVIN
jgi:hypothetical protein